MFVTKHDNWTCRHIKFTFFHVKLSRVMSFCNHTKVAVILTIYCRCFFPVQRYDLLCDDV